MKATTEDAAARLAQVLSCGSSAEIDSALAVLSDTDLQEQCTTITGSGHTVVHLLAQRQKVMALQAILKRGVDVNTRNAQGTTPIHVAFQHNGLAAAKILIQHGANVSETVSRRKGTTLLHKLVMCDRPQAVKLLLEQGAEINCRDKQERTPLHLAAIYGKIHIAALLVQHDTSDANAPDGTGTDRQRCFP